MAQGNPAAIYVQLRVLEANRVPGRNRDGGKGLVDLPDVDVVRLEVSAGQGFPDRGDRAVEHDRRVRARDAGRDESGAGFQLQLPRLVRGRHGIPQAPSLIPLELPAVIRPSGLNAAGRDASFSSDVVRRGCSSVSNIRLLPLSSNTGTGSISFLKRPSSIARTAMRWDQSENSSICSRVILYLSATRSAEMPCCTISYFSSSFGLSASEPEPS